MYTNYMKFKEIRIPTKDINRIYGYIRRESADHQVIASNILTGDHLAEFGRVASLRPDCPSAYLHWVLAFPQADVSNLTPELIAKVWRRFFTLLEVPKTCKYVIVTHGADMQHSHTLLSRIGTDASIYLARFSVRKGIKATETLEKEFGLTITPTLTHDEPQARRPTLNKHEYEQKRRTGLPVRKEVITAILEQSIKRSGGIFDEFVKVCAEEGLTANVVERANGGMGITFTYEGVTYRGSHLGKGFSLSKLIQTLSSIAAGKPDINVPLIIAEDMGMKNLKTASEPSALPKTASKEQQAEAETQKRSLIQRLDKLRVDCPNEIYFSVNLLYHLLLAKLYVPRFYFMVRYQVFWLEEESRDLKIAHAKKAEAMRRGWGGDR